MKRIFYLLFLIFWGLCFSINAAETAETIYAKAYASIYKNNPKEAIRIFEKGQQYYPDCAFLYAGMGDAYLKDGNLDKALEYYTIAQRKKYALDIYKIDFYSANLQKNMKEISIALNELLAATKLSETPTIYKNINFIMNEEYEKTKILTEIYLNTSDLALNLANNLKAAGKKEDALREYLKILNSNPKNFQAATNAGITLFELKDYQLAEKYLLQALENNPNSPIILNNLGVVYLYLQDYKKMEENFAAAIKAKGDYIIAINNNAVSKIHKSLNFYKPENVDSILDVINKNNENYYATRTLAKIYFLKSDYKSAANILAPLESTYNFKLYTQKAYTLFKKGDLEKALENINKAIALYSDNGIDYELRGRIYSAMKKFNDAQLDYEKAIEKNKKSATVCYFQARTYYEQGAIETATKYMKEFLSMKKGNSDTSQLKLLFE